MTGGGDCHGSGGNRDNQALTRDSHSPTLPCHQWQERNNLAGGSDPSCPREDWDLVSGVDLQRTDVLLVKSWIPWAKHGLQGSLTPKEGLGP